MPVLSGYQQFEGRHWETGSVRNFFDYRGVKAPHTGKPFSEAFFMGVSGGAVMGYFSFAYEGYDPHVAILTRNTFDPLDRMLERLGVMQTVRQTSNSQKAVTNLIETLEDGIPAITLADHCSLSYNAYPQPESMWMMMPIVVYGYDEAEDRVHIADRARVPLTITTGELARARGRVKKDKYRLLTLDAPLPERIIPAVRLGIWDCIKLYTEAPPKGARHNFGLAAFRHWADLLAKNDHKMSWARQFPPGGKMVAGLTTAYTSIRVMGKDGGAERTRFADFLDEAGLLLNNASLKGVAEIFRRSGKAWDQLASALLPYEVAPFRQTRELLEMRHRLFMDQGGGSLAERLEINRRLADLRKTMDTEFPLSEAGVAAMRGSLAEQVLAIHDIEAEAVRALEQAMA
jgi:hypothetical protein